MTVFDVDVVVLTTNVCGRVCGKCVRNRDRKRERKRERDIDKKPGDGAMLIQGLTLSTAIECATV